MNSKGYCRSCANRRGQLKRPDVKIAQQRITKKAAISNKEAQLQRLKKIHPQLTPKKWRSIVNRGYGARYRCQNPSAQGYKNYGERGIEFRFDSPTEYAKWIIQNLGLPPTAQHQIDRIDNNGHYEAGNLRWADFSIQANNKRDYRGWRYGNRMRELLKARPDYTIEGLRKFILWGWTDDEIIKHKKGSHIRHR